MNTAHAHTTDPLELHGHDFMESGSDEIVEERRPAMTTPVLPDIMSQSAPAAQPEPQSPQVVRPEEMVPPKPPTRAASDKVSRQ